MRSERYSYGYLEEPRQKDPRKVSLDITQRNDAKREECGHDQRSGALECSKNVGLTAICDWVHDWKTKTPQRRSHSSHAGANTNVEGDRTYFGVCAGEWGPEAGEWEPGCRVLLLLFA